MARVTSRDYRDKRFVSHQFCRFARSSPCLRCRGTRRFILCFGSKGYFPAATLLLSQPPAAGVSFSPQLRHTRRPSQPGCLLGRGGSGYRASGGKPVICIGSEGLISRQSTAGTLNANVRGPPGPGPGARDETVVPTGSTFPIQNGGLRVKRKKRRGA